MWVCVCVCVCVYMYVCVCCSSQTIILPLSLCQNLLSPEDSFDDDHEYHPSLLKRDSLKLPMRAQSLNYPKSPVSPRISSPSPGDFPGQPHTITPSHHHTLTRLHDYMCILVVIPSTITPSYPHTCTPSHPHLYHHTLSPSHLCVVVKLYTMGTGLLLFDT